MRKLITIVMAVIGMMAANAADYIAYSNGKLAENINFNPWWNCLLSAVEANPDGDGQVIKMTYNPNEPGGGATGANFCGGLQVNGGTTIAGPLHSSTMTFSYYATTPCKINIQLGSSGVNETKIINVTDADVNKWNDVSYSIATDFPQVSAKWEEYATDGAADIMGIIVEQIQEGSILYINNVVFKNIDESWTAPVQEAVAAAPVPTQPTSNVISIFGSHYPAATTFGIGGWGQSTITSNKKDAAGNDVQELINFNYLGWELANHLNVNKCDYMHVDYYAKEGNTFALTPISPGLEKVIAMTEVKTGEWNSYDIPLTEWSNVNFEDLFQIKFDQGNGGSGYITNVYFYNSKADMPDISAEVTDITDNSANLTWNVTFPEGYTNTKVTVDGVAQTGNSMSLTGLTPNTSYTHTIVAEGELNGKTNSISKTVNFKTERAAGMNPIWHGVTDMDGFSAVYSIIYNDDKTLTVEAEIETEKETNPNDRNFHIYVGGNEWLKLYDDGTGVLTGTTTSTFEEGTTITWEWYLPYAGAVYQKNYQYVVGSENEAPLSIRIKASADNVTFDGAEISYEVKAPAGADYKVYYVTEGAQAIEATSNPIVLTGLQEHSEYTYEVYAVLGEGEDAIESTHATVSFKTPAKDAVDLVYSDLFAAEFKNAFLKGETEQDRRSIFVTLPWKVVYAKDGTAVYSVDLSQVENIEGLAPQIYWNGFNSLTNTGNGIYEYNFGAQELDATTAISHYFAYNGANVDVRTPYTNWGMEKETPVIGEATNLTMSASKNAVKIDEAVRLIVTAKDANGYYLSVDAVSYNVEGGAYTLENSVFKPESKGKFTITATSGNLSTSTDVYVLSSKEAENILAGMIGVTDTDYIQGGTIENVTDTSLTSQLEWKCGETEEHYLIYDLGANYSIEGIDLLFEGAYATEFTITLTNNRPVELEAEVPASAPAAFVGEETTSTPDVVFNNTTVGIQHYFVQNPTGTHRYVALRTSKALNTGWGIKVRDLKVYGTKDIETGVETIDDSNAPVEYYDLQGVRVANPNTGIYICRQGSKVTKVIIK